MTARDELPSACSGPAFDMSYIRPELMSKAAEPRSQDRMLLKSSGEFTYKGWSVIVRCPNGRRTWRATVTIPEVGQTDFIFDVIY